MMDSMTDDELDTNKGLEPSRIPRIARGSGTTIKEVEQLMVEHKRFAKMIGKMVRLGSVAVTFAARFSSWLSLLCSRSALALTARSQSVFYMLIVDC